MITNSIWRRWFNCKATLRPISNISYARTQSILRKLDALESNTEAKTDLQFTHPLERSLALQLLRFEDALHQSLEDYLPNFVTDYLYETAKLFASFFDQCPVVSAATEAERMTRKILVSLTGKTLKQGLSLLGIQTVERM